MTPALIFLGVGEAATRRHRRPHGRRGLQDRRRDRAQARGLAQHAAGQVADDRLDPDGPARAPPRVVVHRRPEELDDTLKHLHRLRAAARGSDVRPAPLRQPAARPLAATTSRRQPADPAVPTLLVGMLGGLLVGITSVGSGSVIMIALLMLYPGLSAVRLVGTDLVQAVPLVHGRRDLQHRPPRHRLGHPRSRWSSARCPAPSSARRIAPRVPQSFIRRGIVVVLTMSGVALLDKAGWAPLGRRTRPTRC